MKKSYKLKLDYSDLNYLLELITIAILHLKKQQSIAYDELDASTYYNCQELLNNSKQAIDNIKALYNKATKN